MRLALRFCVSSRRSVGRIWLPRIGNIGIGNRRKRNVSGIFDGRRRWIRNRNLRWRRRRYDSWLMARLGRGRLGNLLCMAKLKFFQNESPFVTRRARHESHSGSACAPPGWRLAFFKIWDSLHENPNTPHFHSGSSVSHGCILSDGSLRKCGRA